LVAADSVDRRHIGDARCRSVAVHDDGALVSAFRSGLGVLTRILESFAHAATVEAPARRDQGTDYWSRDMTVLVTVIVGALALDPQSLS
jgi:hypothetical protein